MSTEITEWTFAADVASWINEILQRRPELPWSRAQVERRRRGLRRDLTLFDDRGRPALTGETKWPTDAHGRTPYDDRLVRDAQGKANEIGVNYFFTWNVNRFVLWETFRPGVPITDREMEPFEVTRIRHAGDLANPVIQAQIKAFLEGFLERFAEIRTGARPIRTRPLDERLIDVLEAGLEGPILANLETLAQMYGRDVAFRRRFIRWVVREQGWTHSEEALEEELERAAKLSAYVLVNKLVFYEVLRRSFPLSPLRIATRVTAAPDAEAALRATFARAMEVSNDYETIFQESSPDGFSTRLAVLSDPAVSGWRHLIDQIHVFDFTQLNYDIIGRIFERLISPRERHRYGQHYTRPDVVDLINVFCVRGPEAAVLDPACGGGTFLVRAYARRKWLSGNRLDHAEQLRQLFGIDISGFAQHLTSINLAVRDLIEAPNYPWVAHRDFFAVRPGQMALQLPSTAARARDFRGQLREDVPLPAVDAVVGNPPYIRQEDLPTEAKRYLQALVREEHRDGPIQLSGRSDIYVYFFAHAAAFLKPDGYLGFLTSNSWLDTDYGMKLQRFFLDRFEVVAVIESAVEQWFTEARVATAITILRRQASRELRRANNIRFVQIRVPLAQLVPDTADEQARQGALEQIRQHILASTGETTEQWRIRVINQGQLEDQGYAQAEQDQDEESDGAEGGARYVGTKWGQYLRAPDMYFGLLDLAPDRFVPMRDIAIVERGMTTGANEFFYLQDITDAALADVAGDDREFYRRYALRTRDTDAIRLYRAGDGSAHLLEVTALAPVVFNLMELDRVLVDPPKLRKKVLLVDQPRHRLPRHVRQYVQWGERQGYHERSTCAARVREGREWYELRPGQVGQILWPMTHKYRHLAILNAPSLPCDHRLFKILSKDPADPGGTVLAAILNSTITALVKHQYGRSSAGESTIDTEVIDVKMMRVPDPRGLARPVRQQLARAVEALADRPIGHLQDELGREDRAALDDAVLQALGITAPYQRAAILQDLYQFMGEWYRSNREAEVRTVRARLGRRARVPGPRAIAAELWDQIDGDSIKQFPDDFHGPVRQFDVVDLLSPRVRVGTDLMSGRGMLAAGQVQIGDRIYDLEARERAEYVRALAQAGHLGRVRVPKDPRLCDQAVAAYEAYLSQLKRRFGHLAEERTQDPRLVGRIVDELMRMARNHDTGRAER